MAVWLATQEGVVCPNLRDIFSAGGKECITKTECVIQVYQK